MAPKIPRHGDGAESMAADGPPSRDPAGIERQVRGEHEAHGERGRPDPRVRERERALPPHRSHIRHSTNGAAPSAVSGDQSASATTTRGSTVSRPPRCVSRPCPRLAPCARRLARARFSHQETDDEPTAERMIGYPEQLRGHGRILIALRPPFQVSRDVPVRQSVNQGPGARSQVPITSSPLKSTMTAAAPSALSAILARHPPSEPPAGVPGAGRGDSTCIRKSTTPAAVQAASAACAARSPRRLADQRGRQVIADRRPQQAVRPDAVADRPAARDEIMQDRIAQMPVGVREDQVPGPAAGGPGAAHGCCDGEMSPGHRPRLGGQRSGQRPERVARAQRERDGRPDLEPAEKKDRQRQDEVEHGESIEKIERGWAGHDC